MKRLFKVTIDFGNEDPGPSMSDIWNAIDHSDIYGSIIVEELPVASLSHLQSQPGINPEYKDAILEMEKKVWESEGEQ